MESPSRRSSLRFYRSGAPLVKDPTRAVTSSRVAIPGRWRRRSCKGRVPHRPGATRRTLSAISASVSGHRRQPLVRLHALTHQWPLTVRENHFHVRALLLAEAQMGAGRLPGVPTRSGVDSWSRRRIGTAGLEDDLSIAFARLLRRHTLSRRARHSATGASRWLRLPTVVRMNGW